MKKILAFLYLVFMLATGLAQQKNFLDVPYLETSALVEASVVPDRIYLDITIKERDGRGDWSVENQEGNMIQRLKQLGIVVAEQLTVKDLSSHYKKHFLGTKDVVKRKQFGLLVYDAATASKVLAALEEIGIANTFLVKTDYSKMESLKLELKSKAIIKAKEKANALVAPLGQKLGPALHIVDVAVPQWAPRNARQSNMLLTVEDDRQTPPQTDFEKIRVTSTVNVKFALN